MAEMTTSFTICIDNWETLKSLSKKFDLLVLLKDSAETEIHRLIGAKYKATHISETSIDFNVVKAVGGKEELAAFFGEAKHGPEFFQKMLELYKVNGVTVFYAKPK
jgi:hypothetical protein